MHDIINQCHVKNCNDVHNALYQNCSIHGHFILDIDFIEKHIYRTSCATTTGFLYNVNCLNKNPRYKVIFLGQIKDCFRVVEWFTL